MEQHPQRQTASKEFVQLLPVIGGGARKSVAQVCCSVDFWGMNMFFGENAVASSHVATGGLLGD